MKLGCGAPHGPARGLCDFIGLDVVDAVCESLHAEFKRTEYAPPPLLKRMVEAGWLGRKCGARVLRVRRARRGRPHAAGERLMAVALPSQAYERIPQEFGGPFRSAIAQMVSERVAPRAARQIDADAEYPSDIRALFADHDLFGLPFDGGLRRNRHRGTSCWRSPSRRWPTHAASCALMLAVHDLGSLPIRLGAGSEGR